MLGAGLTISELCACVCDINWCHKQPGHHERKDRQEVAEAKGFVLQVLAETAGRPAGLEGRPQPQVWSLEPQEQQP